MVDYVLVPHEQIYDIKSFNVHRMTETTEHFNSNGCEKDPDHSLLLWEMGILFGSNDKNINGHNAF